MNWAVFGGGMGTKSHSLGGGGVYAPSCRSVSRGTPSRWEWRSNETALGMYWLRSVVSRPSGPSGGVRSTGGSGAGRLGDSRAGGGVGVVRNGDPRDLLVPRIRKGRRGAGG